MRSAIGDEVRREIAAVELHTFDNFEQRVHRLRLFDGDDAVFADLVHRFGDDRADRLVAVGRNRADLCDRVAGNRLRKRCDLSDDFGNCLFDAAFERHRVCTGGNRADAFLEDRLCENRRGRRAVTGDVAGLAEATSRTICAPMFSSVSFNSISLATVTPSLVIVGEPNFLSITTLRPFGPSVTFTASASWLTPRRIAARDSSP